MSVPAPDNRSLLINWASYFANKAKQFVYSEGNDRMSAIGVWPLQFPIHADCSAFVTLLCWLSGIADPNGQNYDHEGYTGTLLSNNTHIAANQVLAGDIVVYGDAPGEHTAFVVSVHGNDILTVSHGGPTGASPCYCWVNTPSANPNHYPVDGREPQTFLRLHTAQVGTPHAIPVS
jgi:hypothetical protein